eukprot:Phypoly_transcript_09421.p1 GENE.Phypoly_transcript_09421~~Phypoly_transcript_09421.p1  ORF type:complete len:443 (+),score=41.54 Phypoly_transcript_09421:22-1350(+)
MLGVFKDCVGLPLRKEKTIPNNLTPKEEINMTSHHHGSEITEKQKRDRGRLEKARVGDQRMKALLLVCLLFLSCTLVFAKDNLSSHPLLSPLYNLGREKVNEKRSTRGEKRDAGEVLSCPVYFCANETQSCGKTFGNAFGGIVSETDCTTGTCSASTNGTCLSLPTGQTKYFGSNCTMNVDTCLDPKYNPTACTTGICPFTPDNQTCDINLPQCNIVTSVCNGSVCVPQSPNGSPCNISNVLCTNECVPSSVSGVDGFCADVASVPVGKPCVSTYQCQYGLFCSEPSQNNTAGLCTTPVSTPTLGQLCASDANCTTSNAETCACMYGATTPRCKVRVQPALLANITQDIEECVASAKCGSLNDVNCLIANCLEVVCRAVPVILNSTTTPNCLYISTVAPLCAPPPRTLLLLHPLLPFLLPPPQSLPQQESKNLSLSFCFSHP